MAKLALLEEVVAPDGTEQVPVLKGGVAKRAKLSALLSAIMDAATAAVVAARDLALTAIANARTGAVDAITTLKNGALDAINALVTTAQGHATSAAASAAISANTLISLAGDVLSEGGTHPQYSSQNAWPAQNLDGSYTTIGAAGGGMSRTYKCDEIFGLGAFLNFAVKLKTGTFAAALPSIKFMNGAVQVGPIYTVGVADATGYRETGPLARPDTATTFLVSAPSNAAGDLFYMALVAAKSAQGAKVFADKSLPVFAQEAIVGYAPIRLAARGNAARVLPDMNGTARAFEQALTIRGVTPFPATLAMLRLLEEDLRSTGLIDKLLYLNRFCGADSPIAARLPFVTRGPFALDNVANFTNFTEAEGLPLGLTIYTGIVPALLGANRYGFAMGELLRDEQTTDTNWASMTDGGNTGIYPRFANLTIGDRFNGGGSGRVQAAYTGSKGLLALLSDTAGTGHIFKNGLLVASDTRAAPATPTTSQIVIRTTYSRRTAAFVMRDATQEDMGALWWAIQRGEKLLGRAITGVDGVS